MVFLKSLQEFCVSHILASFPPNLRSLIFFKFADGSVYQGSWRQGLYHGFGYEPNNYQNVFSLASHMGYLI